MINALITLVKLNKYWNEQQKNQVLAWLDCAKDFGEQVDELATKNEQAKKIIKEFLRISVASYEEVEPKFSELIDQAEDFLKEDK